MKQKIKIAFKILSPLIHNEGPIQVLRQHVFGFFRPTHLRQQGKYSGEEKWGENIWETFCIRIFLLSAAQFEKP